MVRTGVLTRRFCGTETPERGLAGAVAGEELHMQPFLRIFDSPCKGCAHCASARNVVSSVSHKRKYRS